MPPQEPKPALAQDPTKAAAKALEKLLPTAKPPEAAPIPNASGTPEPIAPGGPTITPPAQDRATPIEPVAVPWSGTLSTRYRARHGSGSSDQDLVARLSLDIGRAERDPVTFHLSARGFGDLDGRHRDDAFSGLDHSFGDDVNLRHYTAYFDVHSLPHVDVARLGRQDLDETPVSFDGLRIDSERVGRSGAWLSAYGGVPVHQFEASSRGDSVYGVAGGFKPWADARVRLDWMQLRDDFLATARRDDLLGIRW
ncbi:MAG: hypothetical protein ABIP94_04350 [Planctomycetota bacterium]